MSACSRLWRPLYIITNIIPACPITLFPGWTFVGLFATFIVVVTVFRIWISRGLSKKAQIRRACQLLTLLSRVFNNRSWWILRSSLTIPWLHPSILPQNSWSRQMKASRKCYVNRTRCPWWSNLRQPAVTHSVQSTRITTSKMNSLLLQKIAFTGSLPRFPSSLIAHLATRSLMPTMLIPSFWRDHGWGRSEIRTHARD